MRLELVSLLGNLVSCAAIASHRKFATAGISDDEHSGCSVDIAMWQWSGRPRPRPAPYSTEPVATAYKVPCP